MKKGFLFAFLLTGVTGIFAGAEVKPLMHQMYADIFNLKPYIVSEDAFKDPKNSDAILKSLKHMVDVSRNINHEMKIQRTGFQVSGKILTQQLSEAQVVFETGNKPYALWMLKSTLGVCMNCHTQLPSGSSQLTTLNKGHILTNPFEEAEFLFVLRNFDEAMKLYQQAIDGYPKNVVSTESLEKAIYRQLSYYVRVKRNINELILTLDADLKSKHLPKSLQTKLQGLKAAAIKMKSEPYPIFSNLQEKELRNYVEKALKEELSGRFDFENPQKELQYLKVSSVLFEYLEQNPGTHLKPDILYWLSFCETRFSHQLLYSVPELYLKQCVIEFPKNPVAKKCLTEYQDLVTMAYTGTSGTRIPASVAKEIKMMQELVKQIN